MSAPNWSKNVLKARGIRGTNLSSITPINTRKNRNRTRIHTLANFNRGKLFVNLLWSNGIIKSNHKSVNIKSIQESKVCSVVREGDKYIITYVDINSKAIEYKIDLYTPSEIPPISSPIKTDKKISISHDILDKFQDKTLFTISYDADIYMNNNGQLFYWYLNDSDTSKYAIIIKELPEILLQAAAEPAPSPAAPSPAAPSPAAPSPAAPSPVATASVSKRNNNSNNNTNNNTNGNNTPSPKGWFSWGR